MNLAAHSGAIQKFLNEEDINQEAFVITTKTSGPKLRPSGYP
jgi:hypothetical protein